MFGGGRGKFCGSATSRQRTPCFRGLTSSPLFTAARPVGCARNSSTSSVLPEGDGGSEARGGSEESSTSGTAVRGMGTADDGWRREIFLCASPGARTSRGGDVQQRSPVLVLSLELSVELIGGKLREVRRVALLRLLLRHPLSAVSKRRAERSGSLNRWIAAVLGSGVTVSTVQRSRPSPAQRFQSHRPRKKFS